jgi:flagellar hook assembly protein FlgD
MANATTLSIIPMRHGIKIVINTAKVRENEKIAIYGFSGKLVRMLSAASDEIIWDGKDQQRNNVPAGCYIVKADADKVAYSRNFVFSH